MLHDQSSEVLECCRGSTVICYQFRQTLRLHDLTTLTASLHENREVLSGVMKQQRLALLQMSQPALQVHKRSFAAQSEPGRDVRTHLAAVRGSILEGVQLLFSHIIPQNFPRPQSHPMWQLAEQVTLLRMCSSCA